MPATDYLTDPRAQAIASAARRLVELRDRYVNPPEWVEWVEEPVIGYPPRPVPRDGQAVKALKKRTLTNLYNARPQWLADAHAQLDAAVAAAYRRPAVHFGRRGAVRTACTKRGPRGSVGVGRRETCCGCRSCGRSRRQQSAVRRWIWACG